MRATATAFALALLVSGCDTGSPASPTFESTLGAAEAGAAAEAGFAVCPPGLEATYGSIYTQVLSTSSCGSTLDTCHSTKGSSPAGTGNGLDYSLDDQGVYVELLGDGGGAPAHNIAGDTPVLRVVPFDAGASMLYIKLTTTATMGHYGAGMPLTAPGSVCPATVAAVEAWINGGASFDGGLPEAGAPGDGGAEDAAGDADAGPATDATLD
jgi:hypothetical protein